MTDCIVTGDFNIAIDKKNAISRKLTDIMDKYALQDIYRLKHPSKKEFPGFTRYPYKGQNGQPTRIDIIFINKKYTNVHFQLSTGSSDHKMITINTRKPKIQIEKIKIRKFATAMLDSPAHLNKLNEITKKIRQGDPETIFDSIVSEMHDYSDKYAKDILHNSNVQIDKILRQTRQMEKDFINLTIQQKNQYKKDMAKLINLIKEKEDKIAKLRGSQFQEFGQTGTRQYLQMIITNSQSQIMTSALIDKDTTTTEPSEIADHIWNYYNNAFQKDESLECTKTFFQNPIFQNMKNIFQNCNYLETPITNKETIIGAEKLNTNSVPGIDGITAAMLKCMINADTQKVTNYLNHLLKEGSPKAYQILYKILKKPGKKDEDYEKIENYRPIALMAMAVRLLDKIILNRITKAVQEKQLETFENNIAYKKGLDPRDIIAMILDTLDLIKKSKNDKTCIISIDFSKAFDSLSHTYIIDYLTFLGIPKNLLQFLKNKFQMTTGILKDYMSLKGAFDIKKGILQGSALSGYLFILCLNPLLHMIEKEPKITPFEINTNMLGLKENITLSLPKTSGFADDVNLITQLDFHNNSSPQMDEIIQTLKKFNRVSGLDINLIKTFAFSSYESQTLNQLQTSYKIKNKSNEIIRILGHHFIPYQHIDSIPQLNKITASLARETLLLNKVPLQGRYIITNCFLTSKINYHITQLNNIYKKDIVKIQRIINNYIQAPFTGKAKHQTFLKGGAQVPSIDILLSTGKIISYKSYMHSNHMHKNNIRELIDKFGFKLEHMINSGHKMQNLLLCLLDSLGLERLKTICKKAFQIIKENNPTELPLFGSRLDNTLAKNPKATKKLRVKTEEFSTRNPIFKAFAPITDIRQTFEVNSVNFFKYGIQTIATPTTDINGEYTILSHKNLN